MTGWEVEREQRPACRPPVVSPTGASALMPPPSQGAERLRRRSGRTGSPWGLRVLVVGGLAGAAWLLSGAAAQAADRDPATGLLGAVVHDITAAPLGLTADQSSADRVLRTAVQPSGSGGRHVSGAVTTIPKRLVGTVGEVAGEVTDAVAPSGAGSVVRNLTVPVRLPGEAVDSGQHPPAAAAPEEDRPEPGAGPAPASEPTEPVTVPVRADQPRADRSTAGVSRGERRIAAAEPAVARTTVGKTEVRHRVADVAAPLGAVREAPDGDGPVRVHLGAANGAPASGPGTMTDGGPCAAVLPSAIADSTMACHRLPVATEVEVRRHDAEAPTASPD